jgi:hypothetical protein
MNKLLKSKRRGSAVPLVVVAVVILLAMGVGLLSLGMNTRVYSIRTAQEIAARCAADAGLEMALFEMNEKLKVKPWNDSTLPQAKNVKLPYSDEVCSYRVIGDLAGGYTLISLGESSEARRFVSGRIVLQSGFNHAILTKEQLVLKSDTIVDGYNSADLTDTEFVVDIGSQSNANDSVVLNMGVVVNGDAFVATGADLDEAFKGAGTVTGNKHTSPPTPLPTVTAPDLPAKLAIDATGQTVKLTPADSGTYPEIYLRQLVTKGKDASITPSVLEVSGGEVKLHITGDIQLENSCEIQIGPNASLIIYTDGNIHCRNGSSINSDNPPEMAETLQIFATGEDKQFIDIKAKSEFTGTIYAPDDDVVLYAKGDAYGSVVADSFNYMAGGNFYFDEALRDNVDVNDEAVQFVVTQWREGTPELAILDAHLASME